MAALLGPELAKAVLRPTDRPGEPIHAGLTAANNPAPPPDLFDWLPLLRDAAQLSPQLQSLFQTTAYLALKDQRI